MSARLMSARLSPTSELRLPGEGEGVFHRRELAYRFAQDLEGGGFAMRAFTIAVVLPAASPILIAARLASSALWGCLRRQVQHWKADRGRPERRYGLFCCSAIDSASCSAPEAFLQLPAAPRRDADRHRCPIPQVRVRRAVEQRAGLFGECVGLGGVARQPFRRAAHELRGGEQAASPPARKLRAPGGRRAPGFRRFLPAAATAWP